MGKSFQGVSRINAARTMIEEQLAALDSSVPVGLVAYGNGIDGCDSSRLYAPVELANRVNIQKAVRLMHPAGNTPIAQSLRMVRERMLPEIGDATIVLISDGAESCGGNPELEARKLVIDHPGTRLHIIGMSIEKKELPGFRVLARHGRGRFFDTQTYTDFARAIRLVSDPSFREIEQPGGDGHLIAEMPSFDRSASLERSEFTLKNLKLIEKRGESALVSVDYSFTGAKNGDYFIYILCLLRPFRASGSDETVVAGTLSSGTAAHYDSKNGRGSVTIEIPLNTGRALFIQGELWNISQIPEREALSNILRVRR